MTSKDCPYNENIPHTFDGEVAWKLLTDGSGQWIRSGLDGNITGLNIACCLSRRVANQCDAMSLEELLIAGEDGALSGISKLRLNKEL